MGDPRGSRDERAGYHMPKKPTHGVDEEPVLRDGLSVEEECRTGLGLREEVGRGDGKPLEDGETGARLEHEHRNSLLDEQANNHRRPSITACQQTWFLFQSDDRKLTMGCDSGASTLPRRRTGRRKARGRRSHGRRSSCSIAIERRKQKEHSINVLQSSIECV